MIEKVYGVWAVRRSASIFGHAEAWCKENGRTLEFESRKDAEIYAQNANAETASANVHYYVREKQSERNAIRKPASKQDLGAIAPTDVTPRNDAAEKRNEIPGRQIPYEQESVVPIRSAVRSNYAGMVAMLGADNRLYLGKEEHYYYEDVPRPYYDNRDGTLCFVSDQPEMYYFLYGEGWVYTQEEMLERGLTMQQYEEFARLRSGVLAQFTPVREILFDGKPFQLPENYLRNAELYIEGKNGNYNMIDGRINNVAPEQKPSLRERLKSEPKESDIQQSTLPVPERER